MSGHFFVNRKRTWRFARWWAGLCVSLAVMAAETGVEGTMARFAGPVIAGHLPEAVHEASGLAVSRRDPGLFWTHEDSGGEPVLEAIAADGASRGRVRVSGVRRNVDWEDISSFELDGKAWLLIADTGDNRARRGDCSLLVVEEPEPARLAPQREIVVPVSWRIPVIYPDGPRDVEAVAVDAAENRVYLLAKRTTPHGLYVLPLRPTPPGRPMPPMERIGELPAFPSAEGAQAMLPIPFGMYRAQPTGMDFSADGSAAVIVTYGDVMVYPRRRDERWIDALARTPIRLESHGLPQAEGVGFSADGRAILVVGEGKAAPVLRYERRGR